MFFYFIAFASVQVIMTMLVLSAVNGVHIQVNRNKEEMMAALDDLVTKLDEADADIEANSSALQSVQSRIDQLISVIETLKQELDDAGTDPDKIAEVSGRLDGIIQKLKDQATAEATLANTENDPKA